MAPSKPERTSITDKADTSPTPVKATSKTKANSSSKIIKTKAIPRNSARTAEMEATPASTDEEEASEQRSAPPKAPGKGAILRKSPIKKSTKTASSPIVKEKLGKEKLGLEPAPVEEAAERDEPIALQIARQNLLILTNKKEEAAQTYEPTDLRLDRCDLLDEKAHVKYLQYKYEVACLTTDKKDWKATEIRSTYPGFIEYHKGKISELEKTIAKDARAWVEKKRAAGPDERVVVENPPTELELDLLWLLRGQRQEQELNGPDRRAGLGNGQLNGHLWYKRVMPEAERKVAKERKRNGLIWAKAERAVAREEKRAAKVELEKEKAVAREQRAAEKAKKLAKKGAGGKKPTAKKTTKTTATPIAKKKAQKKR